MAYIPSAGYNTAIYSGDNDHDCKLIINGVAIPNENIESIVIKDAVTTENSELFQLNTFISKEATIIIHGYEFESGVVDLSIGTKVSGSYEYIPIGLFNIDDVDNTYSGKITLKCRDNAIKFEFPYDGFPLIESEGGSASLLEILEDICTQAGITLSETTFTNSATEISVYDNTLTARQYVSYVAEIAGCFAKINRVGELELVSLDNLVTKTIDYNLFKDHEFKEEYKISRVVYEDAINKYEYGVDTFNTLYINENNPFVVDTMQISNIFDKVDGLSFYAGKVEIMGNPCIDPYDIIEFTDGTTTYKMMANYELRFSGVFMQKFTTELSIKSKEETTNIVNSDDKFYRLKTKVNQQDGTITLLSERVTDQNDELSTLSQLVVGPDGITTQVSSIDSKQTELESQLALTNEELRFSVTKSGGNNLIKNSFFDNKDGFYTGWRTTFDEQLISGELPPEDPITNVTYWYCEMTIGLYERGKIYKWNGTSWILVDLDKAYFETLNLDDNIVPYDSPTNTESGRIIKIDGKDINYEDLVKSDYSPSTPAIGTRWLCRLTHDVGTGEELVTYTRGTIYEYNGEEWLSINVEHIFISSEDIILDQNQLYLTFSAKVRQSIKHGNGIVGFALSNKDKTTFNQDGGFTVAYEKYIILTPDIYKDMEEIEININIPKKDLLLDGNYSVTPPEDYVNLWLMPYGPLVVAMQFSTDLMTWIPYTDHMPINCLQTGTVFVYRPLLKTYYDSEILFNDYICKSTMAVLTFYPGFDLQLDTEEPDIRENTYWAEPSSTVKRAKYGDVEGVWSFIEWEDTLYPSVDAEDWLSVPPFPVADAMPIKGYFEVADMKLEYGNTKSSWTLALGEIYGKTYSLNDEGLRIESKDNVMLITEEEIKATYGDIIAFQISKDWAEFQNVKVREVMQTDGWTQRGQDVDGKAHFIMYKVGD